MVTIIVVAAAIIVNDTVRRGTHRRMQRRDTNSEGGSGDRQSRSSSSSSGTKNNKKKSVVSPYRSLLGAVLCTAVVTRQITTLYDFHYCGHTYYTDVRFDPSLDPPAVMSSTVPRVPTPGGTTRATQWTTAATGGGEEAIPSTVWQPWDYTRKPFPCYPPNRRDGLMSTKPSKDGILMQTPTKVGSTTMAGIVLRLIHNRGAIEYNKERNSTNDNNITTTKKQKAGGDFVWKHPRCTCRTNHGSAIDLEFAQRNIDRSFLFSTVRDPIARMRSQFFHFHVSVRRQPPTDANFQKFSTVAAQSNALLRDLTTNTSVVAELETYSHAYQRAHAAEYERQHTPTSRFYNPLGSTANIQYPDRRPNYHDIVTEILQTYDFIAVTERMDDSLVVMKFLLGLTLEDILYVAPSRTAGSFSNGPRTKDDYRPCIYIVPSFLTPGMEHFFYGTTETSEEKEFKRDGSTNQTMTMTKKTPRVGKQMGLWHEHSRGDTVLHQAVNKSLDRTIEEVMGR